MDGDQETLADASEKVVNKALERANNKRGRGSKRKELSSETISNLRLPKARKNEGMSICGAPATLARAERETELARQQNEPAQHERDTEDASASRDEEEVDWDDGSEAADGWNGELTIEVENASAEKKPKGGRRANAKDKEFAELVHKAHLLCLLARGRLVDAECDDQLLKASIFSLLPPRLTSIDPENVGVPHIVPLVRWLSGMFRITEDTSGDSLSAGLRHVLTKQSGSEEEVAAVTVALFRALGFKTRYVCVLNATSLKPDAESLVASKNWGKQDDEDPTTSVSFAQSLGKALASSFPRVNSSWSRQKVEDSPSSTRRAFTPASDVPAQKSLVYGSERTQQSPASSSKATLQGTGGASQTVAKKRKGDDELDLETARAAAATHQSPASSKKTSQSTGGAPRTTGRKRKGDEEFELEMARAIAATGAASEQKATPPRQTRAQAQAEAEASLKRVQSSFQGSPNSSIWSRKKGPLQHWAEVYAGDDTSGKWCHVDAARNLVDDVEKVEASNRQPVRYVVAFAGSGARDVTRRYVRSWFKLAGLRVEQEWWDTCLAPLSRLEEDSFSTTGSNPQERIQRENMELQVKSFTEPLPTNQQAYRNHHLYAMERWLTRYQCIYPKGPILGYRGGNPVYPRTCVQDLHTKERWLREGFAVKAGEEPVKVLKARSVPRSKQSPASKMAEDGTPGDDERSSVLLFGKWQTEPWQPPAAVNGIVPKNERGQVEVWSEKCIPPGTVHLRMPRLTPVAQRLGVDFAPAMVGFEIRQGRSVPVFEGIVVCEEYKDAIMEVYRAQEEQRTAELQKKREEQAAVRWGQLLRSMIVRERLRVAYEGTSGEAPPVADVQKPEEKHKVASTKLQADEKQHVHNFPSELQSYDEETYIRIKRCVCGFEMSVEEM